MTREVLASRQEAIRVMRSCSGSSTHQRVFIFARHERRFNLDELHGSSAWLAFSADFPCDRVKGKFIGEPNDPSLCLAWDARHLCSIYASA